MWSQSKAFRVPTSTRSLLKIKMTEPFRKCLSFSLSTTTHRASLKIRTHIKEVTGLPSSTISKCEASPKKLECDANLLRGIRVLVKVHRKLDPLTNYTRSE